MLCCTLAAAGLFQDSQIAVNTAMLAVPLLWLFVTKRPLAIYGLSAANLRGQLAERLLSEPRA